MFSSDTNTPSLRTDFNRVVSGTFLVISAGLSGAFAALTGDMSYLGLGAVITGLGVLANYKLSSHSLSQQDCPEHPALHPVNSDLIILAKGYGIGFEALIAQILQSAIARRR